MERPISVQQDYQCPFCTSHQDDVFYPSVLIGVPICEGGSEELFIYEHADGRPTAPLIERVEAYTHLAWEECSRLLTQVETHQRAEYSKPKRRRQRHK